MIYQRKNRGAGKAQRRKPFRIKKEPPQNREKQLEEIIKKFSQPKVLVIGDYVSDRYLYGKPLQLSREAPVVVLRHEAETIVPGGAGNVVYNVASCGAKVYAVGLLGNDEEGNSVLSQLKKRGQMLTGYSFLILSIRWSKPGLWQEMTISRHSNSCELIE